LSPLEPFYKNMKECFCYLTCPMVGHEKHAIINILFSNCILVVFKISVKLEILFYSMQYIP
jgi:hypothetical protein